MQISNTIPIMQFPLNPDPRDWRSSTQTTKPLLLRSDTGVLVIANIRTLVNIQQIKKPKTWIIVHEIKILATANSQ